jgi:hypothetical protein
MRKFGTPRFLPDKPFVQSTVIPATSFLAGLIVYQIVRLSAFTSVSRQYSSGGRTADCTRRNERARWNQQDRQLMNAWKISEAGRQKPPVIVESSEGNAERSQRPKKPPLMNDGKTGCSGSCRRTGTKAGCFPRRRSRIRFGKAKYVNSARRSCLDLAVSGTAK